MGCAHLVDVLALELREELGETLLIGLDADGLEDGLDVLSGGGGVATELEKEVSGQVLHFDGCAARSAVSVGGDMIYDCSQWGPKETYL